MIDRIDEEKSWQWYLAYLANPVTDIISFNEFKEQNRQKKETPEAKPKKKKQRTGMTKEQIDLQVVRAERMLKLVPAPEE